MDEAVSTHSRLKAAGFYPLPKLVPFGFNTQPPKGGWVTTTCAHANGSKRFNTQPPKGGWVQDQCADKLQQVSTHSRLKAAGAFCQCNARSDTGFNTQPPKGGWTNAAATPRSQKVSTHSRLKAAGHGLPLVPTLYVRLFQHTAA